MIFYKGNLLTFSTPRTFTLRTELEKFVSILNIDPRLSYVVKETVIEESEPVIVGWSGRFTYINNKLGHQKELNIIKTFKESASQILLFEVPVFFFMTVMDMFGNFISTDDPISTVIASVLDISAVIFRIFVAVFLSSCFSLSDVLLLKLSLLT